MNELNSAIQITRALDAQNAEYMVSGSFASNYWGKPRSTQDIDVVIRMEKFDYSAFVSSLGPEFRADHQMQFETVTATRRYVVVHTPTQFKAELFELSNDPFDQSRFSRRINAKLADESIPFSTPEDTIVQKLRWLKGMGADKHRQDVRTVLAVQQSSLDWNYIRRWTDEHGTGGLLDEILKSIEKKAPGG